MSVSAFTPLIPTPTPTPNPTRIGTTVVVAAVVTGEWVGGGGGGEGDGGGVLFLLGWARMSTTLKDVNLWPAGLCGTTAPSFSFPLPGRSGLEPLALRCGRCSLHLFGDSGELGGDGERVDWEEEDKAPDEELRLD